MTIISDIFDIKLHYPMSIFIYKSNMENIYQFYKFLNRLRNETFIIDLGNFEFISLDELDISRNYRLKKVLVPKGDLLLKVFLGFIDSLGLYHYSVPIPKSNPFGKRLLNKEKRDKTWHDEWQQFLKYISLIKDKFIRFSVFDDEFIGLIVSNATYLEPKFEVNELVKLKKKAIYGRVVEVRKNSVFLDNGEFYNKDDLIRVNFEPCISLKPKDNYFLINFFVKNLNRELIKFGFEMRRKKLEFERVEYDFNSQEFLRDKRVKIIYKNENIRKKFLNFEFPFIIDDNAKISFQIDSTKYLKKPYLLYKEIAKKFINVDFNCPRVYSKEPVRFKLKNNRVLVAKNYISAMVQCVTRAMKSSFWRFCKKFFQCPLKFS